LIFCAGALLYALWPLREAYRSWNDFRFVYVAGVNWLHGISPYDFEAWVHSWRGVPHDFLAGSPTQPFVYPPHWAILAVPLGALPWAWATRLWDALSVAAFVAIIVLCGSMLGLGRRCWSRPGLWLLVAAATFSGVVRYALWESQMSLLPTLGVVGAVSAWRRGSRPALAAFSFVAALKPQIAALPLLFLLLNGGHAGVLRGAVWAAVVSIAALAPVGLAEFPEQFHRCLRLHLAAGFNQRDNFTSVSVLWAHARAAEAMFWVSPALALGAVGTLTWWRRSGGALAAVVDDPLCLLSLLASLSAALVPLHQYDLVLYTPVFFLPYRARPAWLSLALVVLVGLADRPHVFGGRLGRGDTEPWLTLGVAVLCAGALIVNQGGAAPARPLLPQASR
jgi:hypothetical protein